MAQLPPHLQAAAAAYGAHVPSIHELVQAKVAAAASQDEAAREAAVAFYGGLQAFVLSARLPHAKAAALFLIAEERLAGDAAEWQTTADASFAKLQATLLRYSVERPPASVGLLQPSEAVAFVEWMLSTYYAHFQLYKAALASIPTLVFRQEAIDGVEGPTAFPPLAQGIFVSSGESS